MQIWLKNTQKIKTLLMKNKSVRLCLMSCCAPCSAGAILECKKMQDDGKISDFAVLFYNPNIFPESEYQKRLDEQIRYCEKLGVKYHTEKWDHENWLACTRGLESEPERGLRCTECFKYRFLFGIKWAYKNNFNAIASVFGVSRHKSQTQVDGAAQDILHENKSDIIYMPIKWDMALCTKINSTSDFYRQKYCGCEFSMKKA